MKTILVHRDEDREYWLYYYGYANINPPKNRTISIYVFTQSFLDLISGDVRSMSRKIAATFPDSRRLKMVASQPDSGIGEGEIVIETDGPISHADICRIMEESISGRAGRDDVNYVRISPKGYDYMIYFRIAHDFSNDIVFDPEKDSLVIVETSPLLG